MLLCGVVMLAPLIDRPDLHVRDRPAIQFFNIKMLKRLGRSSPYRHLKSWTTFNSLSVQLKCDDGKVRLGALTIYGGEGSLVGPGRRQRLLFTDVRWPLMRRWYFYTTTAIWQTREMTLLLVRSSSKDTILLLSHYHEASLWMKEGHGWGLTSSLGCHSAQRHTSLQYLEHRLKHAAVWPRDNYYGRAHQPILYLSPAINHHLDPTQAKPGWVGGWVST